MNGNSFHLFLVKYSNASLLMHCVTFTTLLH